MNRILHHTDTAQRILDLTADTMLMIDHKGICIDIDTHSNLWFLQENNLLGKNVFDLLPKDTREKIVLTFQAVLQQQKSISKNFKLELEDATYYFKCIMYPYDDMVLCQYRDITQRSNIKRLLEQANRNLREIQKAAQIGQWSYNTDQRIFHYLGHTGILCVEKVQNISITQYQEMIVEDDLQSFIEWTQRNQEESNEESLSYRIRINGEIFYVKVQTYLREECPDGSYNLEGYIQNISDIQQRRNDINTLTHAINNAKESIFAAKEDGTLIFANRQFMQHHGIAKSENLSKHIIYNTVGDMYSIEDWQQRCQNVMHGGSCSFVAHYPIKKSKETLAFEGIMYSVTNDSNELSYWSFSHDISERLHYEAEIKRLNQIMNQTIDNLPAGIVIKDSKNEYNYIYRNQESYNRVSCIGNSNGKSDYDFFPPEEADIKRQEDIQVAQTGKELHWITEEKDRNGNMLILDKKKMRIGGNDLLSPIIISIEWDITELEMVKRELQASKEKAEMSDKLKSAFLANMSHEIRTPLNAIVGFSHLIAESDDPEERKSYHAIVEANNERLLELINEILDLSKIEAGIVEFTLGPVNLHSLCQEVHDAHVFRTPMGVELIYEPSDEKLMIETDKNRVFQVISNLIGNAFKFTKEGNISYGFKLQNNTISFHVTDTGMGIEPEKVGRVFERFAKLNNIAQGTGLGLSICKTIIERLGGEISVTSEVGKGTTFTFTLMYRNVQPQNNSESVTKSMNDRINGASGSGSTASDTANKAIILIAEDTDSNFDLLKAFLNNKYDLLRAKDGMETVTMYDAAKPDLILMDICMPNLDGLEATKIIRELSPTVPIIIQSAYAYEEDRKASEEAGCTDFISKPIPLDKLQEIINKWLM